MNFQKGAQPNVLAYPFCPGQIAALQDCDLVNPFAIGDPRVLISPEHPSLTAPLFPDEEGFHSELLKTARFTHLAKREVRLASGSTRDWSQLTAKPVSGPEIVPQVFKDKYAITFASDLAELVHNDSPIQLLVDLLDWLRADGAKIDSSLFPKRPWKTFTDGVVLLYRLPGDLVHTISPTAFAHKYYYGMPRPEEVIGAWARGEYEVPQIVDEELRHYVDRNAVAKDQRTFTTYPEGCPNHPSFPAMHSAVASAGMSFSVLLNLSPGQKEQCTLFSSAVAYGRTAAGVHYPQDNAYGLRLGEACIPKVLTSILAIAGADPAAVNAKCEAAKTDW